MSSNPVIIGIQGYKGSFNDEASTLYCEDHGISAYTKEYLYTTDRVFNSLELNQVNYGIFALSNNLSGVILESVDAMGAHLFDVLDVFDMPVVYSLLVKKGVKKDKIDRIVSHPSIIDACREELDSDFSDIQIESGSGVLIDQAAVAAHLAEVGSPDSLAVIAPQGCATLYGLDILVEKINTIDSFTTFVWCKRR